MMTVLEKAIRAHDLTQVRSILNETPTLAEKAEDGILPIFLAAQYGSLEILQYFVEYSRASLDVYDERHRSALFYAVLSGDVSKCRYLIERCGLSPLEGDRDLITPYQLAYENCKDTLYPYFLSVIQTPYTEMYHNPIRRGFYPDPSILRVWDDYYMVNSTFVFFPCIPVSHSRDLIHWTIIGYAITDPQYAGLAHLEGGRGYWAPDISYDNGRFYITATLRVNDNEPLCRKQMVVYSDRPEGPYSTPVLIEEDGIDPSLFHENGRHYMLLNRGARIFELSADCTEMISEPFLLYYGSQKHAPEGAHLLKKDGWYYLFQAEGGTGMGHRITVSRSRELMGIYQPCPYNPIMRQHDPSAPLQRCGHGKPVQTADGRWYMVYLCGRRLNGEYTVLGRETALDPITWTPDGWPIVNDLKGPSVLSPLPIVSSSKQETAFGTINWPHGWLTPREPQKDAVMITEEGIRLLSSPAAFSSYKARNLLLRRQESFSFTASITLQLPALKEGQNAGLICYYDEYSYAYFMVGNDENGMYCSLHEHIHDKDNIHTRHALDSCMSTYVFTVITEGLKRTLILQSENGTELCREVIADASYLSDEGIPMNKRFTGALFGAASYGTEPFFYTLKAWECINQD